MVSALLQVLIAYKIFNNEKYPFTEPIETAQQGGGATGKAFLFMLIVGVFVIFHLIISFIPFAIYGYLVVLIVLTAILWEKTFK